MPGNRSFIITSTAPDNTTNCSMENSMPSMLAADLSIEGKLQKVNSRFDVMSKHSCLARSSGFFGGAVTAQVIR